MRIQVLPSRIVPSGDWTPFSIAWVEGEWYVGWKTDEYVDQECPQCGSIMVLKTVRDTGKKFYGCGRFPDCRGSRAWPPIDLPRALSAPPPLEIIPPEDSPPHVDEDFIPQLNTPYEELKDGSKVPSLWQREGLRRIEID